MAGLDLSVVSTFVLVEETPTEAPPTPSLFDGKVAMNILEKVSDHEFQRNISKPRWSFGPRKSERGGEKSPF